MTNEFSHFWSVEYTDDSRDLEGNTVKFHELSFDFIKRFILMPYNLKEDPVILSINKPENTRIIFRKRRRQQISLKSGETEILPAKYFIGIIKDDGSDFLKNVELAKVDCNVDKLVTATSFLFDGKYIENAKGTSEVNISDVKYKDIVIKYIDVNPIIL